MSPASDITMLLTSPGSGSFNEDALSQVRAVLDESGQMVRIHRLGEGADDDGPLAQAVRRRFDRLVIVGGDGAVHHVVGDLDALGWLSADRPLGVIPMGTGNDLARGLGLPLDPADAARVLVEGHVHSMDLLDDGAGTLVVNAAHAGAGAEASERGAAFKPAMGPLGYALGAVLAGVATTGWSMQVEVDGRVLASRASELLMVGLAIGPTIGGGTPLAPDADPGDGLADVVVVSATGPLERADFARRLRHGTHDERDDVLVARGSSVTIDAGQAPLNVDGELVGEAGTRTWTVRPAAWSVIAPIAPQQ